MAVYEIRIVVTGEDRASGPLNNVGGALGNMGQIAGGILGAGLFMKIANGFQGMLTQSIAATEGMQQMQVGMEGLIARELKTADAAQMAALGLEQTGEMAKTINDFLPQAGEKAKGLMEELAKIAVLSPYQTETIQNTFKTAMAFGFSTEEAKKYTTALLNVAAGTGANNEMMGRMAYNLAQVRMQGKVTGTDLRQLSMAGFDLTSVLKYVGNQFGVTVKDHNDFNDAIASGKITWEQFTDSFAKYAQDNFGGASERMARTLGGLRSTFGDLFTLTMPKVLGKGVEVFTGFANRVLDSFLKIRDSGLLEKIGDGIGSMMEQVVTYADPFLKTFDQLFSLLAQGVDPLEALKITIGTIFGVDTIAEALAFNQIFQSISTTFQNVSTFVSVVAEYFVQIGNWLVTTLGPWVSWKDVLIALGIVLAATILPILGSLIVSLVSVAAPILALIAVVALARNAWEGNWGGIRDFLTVVWNEHLQPALSKLWEWLSINVPIALQKLSDFWTNILQPALEKVWHFLSVTMMPIWKALGNLLKSFYELWLVNLQNQFKALVAVWETILKPALDKLFEWLGKGVDWFTKVTGGVDGVATAINNLARWFDTLKDKIANLKLPDWLTPGSPTPLELGIKGITGALSQLNKTALPKFDAGLSGLSAGQAGGGGQSVTIGNVNIHAQPGQDGAALYRQFRAELERDLRMQRNNGLGLARF